MCRPDDTGQDAPERHLPERAGRRRPEALLRRRAGGRDLPLDDHLARRRAGPAQRPLLPRRGPRLHPGRGGQAPGQGPADPAVHPGAQVRRRLPALHPEPALGRLQRLRQLQHQARRPPGKRRRTWSGSPNGSPPKAPPRPGSPAARGPRPAASSAAGRTCPRSWKGGRSGAVRCSRSTKGPGLPIASSARSGPGRRRAAPEAKASATPEAPHEPRRLAGGGRERPSIDTRGPPRVAGQNPPCPERPGRIA